MLSDIDALILVGGQGTRIRHLLPEGVPKCMADVGGRPFLRIFVDHLTDILGQSSTFLFATGYGEAAIRNYIETVYRPGVHGVRWWKCCDEARPLGTAGAVKDAIEKAISIGYQFNYPFFIFNADTYCDVNCKEMLARHEATKSTITVACDEEFGHVGTFVASKRFVDLIPKVDGKVDMAEIFTLLGQRHEPVGWFLTDAPFYDIGDETGLSKFRILMLQHGTLNVQ